MAVSPARAAAFDILRRVERHQAYASEILHSDKLKTLSPSDHGLATQLTMGVLRWQSALDHSIASMSSQALDRLDPEVLVALRLGVFQLQHLDRVPARAAIFESVELTKQARKKSAAPFVNAVLRKMERSASPRSIEDSIDADSLAAASAHPAWLVERWVQRYGLETTRAICKHDQSIPEVALALREGMSEQDLSKAGLQLEAGRLLTRARRLVAGNLVHNALFKSGKVLVQDEASQLVALLVGKGEQILDCCAAPGGKTSLMSQRNRSSRIVAIDLHPHRATLLRRLARGTNVNVISADATCLPLTQRFDRVLADVPCSGTGTLAHNPEIKWRLQPTDFEDLAGRQIRILDSALDRVAPGGRAVYSTCSLEPEENEAIVEQALARHTEFRLVDCRTELEGLRRVGELAWQDLDSLLAGPYLRTLPGIHPCDGFFAAVIEEQ